ncbi:MAG TPA: hypothetical protein VHO69_19220 [Phototrophicaceae bacterium]|nr:hypothetical protein [Phototrophicaceae bacterium]
MIDLNNFYSGGYYLVRGVQRQDWMKTNLLPETIISLSHLCPRYSILLGWMPDYRQEALDFGIPEDKLDELDQWCSAAYEVEIGFPLLFYTLEGARRFVQRFLPDTENLYLLGAGLPQEREEKYWRDLPETERLTTEKRIQQHLPLAPGGAVLGFEVLSVCTNEIYCSWLCYGLEQEMNTLFGIVPNQYGLINHYEEAKKVSEWIDEDWMRAGADHYDFWVVVSYPLVESHS